MANNSNAAIQVLAGGAGPGVGTDVRTYAAPVTISYIGAVNEVVRFDVSAAAGTGWAIGLVRTITAVDEGEISFVISESISSVRCEVLSGNALATASASATGQPLAERKPFTALTVNNDATPGPWGDCRTIGAPRTIVYAGFAGDTTYIEGSDDGATLPYQVYPTSGSTGITAATYLAETEKLPNFMRIVRPAGVTPGARCDIVGPSNQQPLAGNLVNGGQSGPVGVGTTNATGVAVIANSINMFAADGLGNIFITPEPTGELRVTPGAGGFGVGGAADASALLDLQSTTRGFGLVRMTTVQRLAIPSPRAGLMVYDTDIGAPVTFNGTAWEIPVIVIATNTSAQVIADGAPAANVTGWTEVLDTAGAFNAATGVFTVPAGLGGRYSIGPSLQFAATAALLGVTFSVHIARGGVAERSNSRVNPVAALAQTRAIELPSPVLVLAPGDLISVQAELSANGGVDVALTASAVFNYLSIVRLGP